MVDLDRAFDRAAAEQHELDVEDVHEGETTRCDPAADRMERGRDVEQVIDRLAEEHEVEGPGADVGVLGEPGNGLHPGSGSMGELVGRGIEHGRGGSECVPDGAGDDPGRAADVEHAARGRRQREPQELDELGGVDVVAPPAPSRRRSSGRGRR